MKNLLIILALVIIPPIVATFIPWQRVTVQVYTVADTEAAEGVPVEKEFVRGWLYDGERVLPVSITESSALKYQRSYDIWATPFWKWSQPVEWYAPPELPGSE